MLEKEELPEKLALNLSKKLNLRYGENPHQKGAFYTKDGANLPFSQVWGKELSSNNVLDADTAWNIVSDFSLPTVTIVKHGNPCGLASRDDVSEAFYLAFDSDRTSAFGGVVAVNREPTEMIKAMKNIFFEVVVAPDFSSKTLFLLKRKSEDIRVIKVFKKPQGDFEVRTAFGGYLVQEKDHIVEDPRGWQCVTKRLPNEEEVKDLVFAWKAVKHVKSNAVVLAKDQVLVGIGTGQPNRVGSVELALKKARERSKRSVLASDAFFPFLDAIRLCGSQGVSAIVQPGGSRRDQEVIEMADQFAIAMLFTGVRHFKH